VRRLLYIVGGIVGVGFVVGIASQNLNQESGSIQASPTASLTQETYHAIPVESLAVSEATPASGVSAVPARVTPVPTYATAKTACGSGYYRNVNGVCVPNPTYAPAVPAGATARCRDGTYSFSQNRSGTCSHHGGVERWFVPVSSGDPNY
jgi:hypothetical protein